MTTPTHTLTTTTTPITQLHPHPDNPRNGDTDAIAESLTTNGQYRPIVTTTDGTILAGNHTYAAAMELGWEQIDVVTLDLDPNSAEAYRIMLADNRTADLGRYDDGILLALLEQLTAVDDGLVGTGYVDDPDLTILRRKVEANLTFGLDQSAATDEFLGDMNVDGAGVQSVAFDTIRVSFRDEPARADFFNRLGIPHEEGRKAWRWPTDWKPQPLSLDTDE